MSLILDALRRADSERERGSVPKLSSVPVPPQSAEARAPSALGPWHWMAIGVGIGLLVVLGAYIFGRQAAQQEAAATALSRLPAAAAEDVPPQAPAAPAAPVAPPAAPTASLPVAEPAPWPAAERPSDTRRPPAKAAPAAPAPAPANAVPAPTVAAAPAAPPVYRREQLPASVRAQLPSIQFGGSMYSANPAHRSLIINGLIYREKDAVATGLWLEQIRPKGAVFRFGDYLVEVPY